MPSPPHFSAIYPHISKKPKNFTICESDADCWRTLSSKPLSVTLMKEVWGLVVSKDWYGENCCVAPFDIYLKSWSNLNFNLYVVNSALYLRSTQAKKLIFYSFTRIGTLIEKLGFINSCTCKAVLLPPCLWNISKSVFVFRSPLICGRVSKGTYSSFVCVSFLLSSSPTLIFGYQFLPSFGVNDQNGLLFVVDHFLNTINVVSWQGSCQLLDATMTLQLMRAVCVIPEKHAWKEREFLNALKTCYMMLIGNQNVNLF